MWIEYSTNRWERRRAATRLVGDKIGDLTATDESHVKDPSNHCKWAAWNKRDALPVAAGSVLCHPVLGLHTAPAPPRGNRCSPAPHCACRHQQQRCCKRARALHPSPARSLKPIHALYLLEQHGFCSPLTQSSPPRHRSSLRALHVRAFAAPSCGDSAAVQRRGQLAAPAAPVGGHGGWPSHRWRAEATLAVSLRSVAVTETGCAGV